MGPGILWIARKANSADMIISARIWKWPATNRTERMRNKLNLRPTGGTEVFAVTRLDRLAARAAARRIKPIHQRVQALGKRWMALRFLDPATLQNDLAIKQDRRESSD